MEGGSKVNFGVPRGWSEPAKIDPQVRGSSGGIPKKVDIQISQKVRSWHIHKKRVLEDPGIQEIAKLANVEIGGS